MATVRWGFEQGSNNDALAADNASADFIITSGGAATISTAQAFEGTRSTLMTATTASGGVYLSKAITATTRIGFDTYIYVTALPSSEMTILWIGNGSPRQCSLAMAPDGKIRIRDGGGASAWTSTVGLAVNVWYRVSFFATQDATNGTVRAAFYAGSSTVALDDSTLLTAQNTGSLPYDILRLGAKATTNTVTMTAYFDQYSYDTAATGLLSVNGSPSASATVSSPVGLIDATASSGVVVTYSIAQLSGPTKTPAVVSAGIWAVAVDASQDTTWRVTVTQSDSQTDTTDVVIPHGASAATAPVELLYATGPGVFI